MGEKGKESERKRERERRKGKREREKEREKEREEKKLRIPDAANTARLSGTAERSGAAAAQRCPERTEPPLPAHLSACRGRCPPAATEEKLHAAKPTGSLLAAAVLPGLFILAMAHSRNEITHQPTSSPASIIPSGSP